MPRFRRRPIIVEAEQFLPEQNAVPSGVLKRDDGRYYVETLEGPLTVSPGDWIITGVQGEIYPCKPDIFTQIYEPAADT